MGTFNCEYCGKEFSAKPSSHRKYCSKECSNLARKGVSNPKNAKEKVLVTCAECGKEEYVNPCRAIKYVCCSVECLSKYNSKRYSQKIECICPICKTHFFMKPYRVKRVNTNICCSKACSNKLKETTYTGENNHQYGLKGELNSSFKGAEISRINHNIVDIHVYKPEHPRANKYGRVTKHRLVVEENYMLFDSKYFDVIDGFHILKEGYCVHHKDFNHDNNDVNNLQILTNSEHTKLHNSARAITTNKYKNIVGVLKQGELLGLLEVDNQQPSLDSNILEGSETNSRVLDKDSNANTSALLQQILDIVGDDIVRTADITEDETAEQEDKELLG